MISTSSTRLLFTLVALSSILHLGSGNRIGSSRYRPQSWRPTRSRMMTRYPPAGCYLDCGPHMYRRGRCECACPEMDMMRCPIGVVQVCEMNSYNCPSCRCERPSVGDDDITSTPSPTTSRPTTGPRRTAPEGCALDCGPYMYYPDRCKCMCPQMDMMACPEDQVQRCSMNEYECPSCACEPEVVAPADLPDRRVRARDAPRGAAPEGCDLDCGSYMYYPYRCECMCPQMDMMVCPEGQVQRCSMNEYGCPSCACELANDRRDIARAAPRRTAPEGCDLDCGSYMYYPDRCECMCPQMDMMVCPEGQVQRCSMNEYGCPSCACEPEVVAPADMANDRRDIVCPQMNMLVCSESQVQRCSINEYVCPSCVCGPEEARVAAPAMEPTDTTTNMPAREAPRRTAPEGCDLDCGPYIYYQYRCECMCPPMDMMACPEGQVQSCGMNEYGCPSCTCEPEVVAPADMANDRRNRGCPIANQRAELVCQPHYVTRCVLDFFRCPLCRCEPESVVEHQAEEGWDISRTENEDFEFSFGIRVID